MDTDVPRRRDPSEIHVVYSIYGIVSEHTSEEWEVILEHKDRGWTMSRLLVDDEQRRMKDTGFELCFQHLDEGAPPPKIPTPSVLPTAPPILPATPAPAEQSSDDTIPIPEREPQSGLGITDTIIGIFGGTRGDYVAQYFNFLYGVGNNMSLGIGSWLRSTFFDDQADYGSSWYYIGSWVGFVADLAIGGTLKSTGKFFGKELLEGTARIAANPSAIRSHELAADFAQTFYRSFGEYGRTNDVLLVLAKGGYSIVNTAGKTSQKMRLLAYADEAFKRSLEYYKNQGITDVSKLGRLAGAIAEKILQRWAKKHNFGNVRTKDVKLGIGKFSWDGKWSPGKLLFDFKNHPMRLVASSRVLPSCSLIKMGTIFIVL